MLDAPSETESAGRVRAAAAVVIACGAALSCFVSSDGDLGFHLATGREVLSTGKIPALNVLSFTQPEHAWRLHQWLPGVLFELLFRRFGIAAVILAKMLMVGAIWGVVFAAARKLGASARAAALGCVLAATASAFRFEARPFLFTHLTLALTVLSLSAYVHAARGGSAAGQRRALLGMALVAALAAQLHAGVLDSFLVMLIAAVSCSLQPLFARIVRQDPALAQPAGFSHTLRLLVATLAAVALAALALALYHPNGPRILLFPFEVARDTYLAEHLVEFRSPWRFPMLTLAATWLWLALVLCVLVARVRVLHLLHVTITLAYALLALRFARMSFALGVVSAPVVAVALTRAPFAIWSALRPRLRDFVLVGALCVAPLYVFRDHTPGFGFSPLTWPLGHFAFMRNEHVQGRAFVSNAWAGPMLGMFYPERTVFFDNRLEAYSPEFLREVYQPIAYGVPGWSEKLDRYDVQVVLLRYTSAGEVAFQHGAPNLHQKLARDPRWTLVRFDDDGELFVRTRGPNAALAERHALRGVDPDRRSFMLKSALCAPALLAAVQAGNHASTMLLMAALAAADAGQRNLGLALSDEASRADPADVFASRVHAAISDSAR